MIEKFSSIISDFNKKLLLLCLLFIIVALFDLVGITILLQLMNLIMDYESQGKIVNYFTLFFGAIEQQHVIILFALFLIVFAVTKNSIKFITSRFQFSIVKNMHHSISVKISQAYLGSDYYIFSKSNPQTLIKNSIDSVNVFITFMVIGGLNFISNSLVALILIGFLFYKSFIMTALILTIIMSINYLFIGLTKKNNKVLQQERESLIANMYDGISNIIYNKLEIFTYQKEKYFQKKYASDVRAFDANRYKFNIINSLPSIYSDFILYFSISILVIILFFFSMNTQEAIEMLLLYALVMIRIIPISSNMITALNNIRYYSDSINIIYEMINLRPYREHRTIDKKSRKISITDMSATYGDKVILSDINLTIPINKKIAFVGESGSGKTTLSKVIAGVLQPKSGEVKSYSTSIAYVAQEPYFFSGSILENILFDDPKEYDHVKLEKVLKICLLDNLVEQLPNGIHTNIGHRASFLSGGQKQRVALARAMYYDSDIIILDEVTSALDNNSEQAIRETIDNIKDRTIIMIAHRLSSIKNFDEIILMADGTIIDRGSYSELLSRSSFFAKLAKSGEKND